MSLRALADHLAAALTCTPTQARRPGLVGPRQEQLTSALESAFPRSASCRCAAERFDLRTGCNWGYPSRQASHPVCCSLAIFKPDEAILDIVISLT